MTRFQLLLVKLVTFLGGLYFVLEFLLPEDAITTAAQYETIINAVNAIGASAFAVGLISLFKAHGKKIMRRKMEGIPSMALLFGVIVMTISSGYSWYEESRASRETKEISELILFASHLEAKENKGHGHNGLSWPQRVNLMLTRYNSTLDLVASKTELRNFTADSESQNLINQNKNEIARLIGSSNAGDQEMNLQNLIKLQNAFLVKLTGFYTDNYNNTPAYKLYKLLFENVMGSLTTAMFSLLAFFMATAAFRAFRVRSFEAFLMVASGIIVILGQIPFGIYLSESLPEIRLWLLQIPSSAAFRAIKIGAEIAALLLIFRIWLSLESDAK